MHQTTTDSNYLGTQKVPEYFLAPYIVCLLDIDSNEKTSRTRISRSKGNSVYEHKRLLTDM